MGGGTPIREPGTSIPYVEIIQGPNKADYGRYKHKLLIHVRVADLTSQFRQDIHVSGFRSVC
jgi:hypothetical protein